MARSFNGTSDAITASVGSLINGVTKLAVVFWMDWTSFSNNDDLAMEYSTNYNSNSGFIMDPNGSTGGGGGNFEVGVNSGAVNVAYFTRPSAGLHHYVFNLDANGSVAVTAIPSVYVDGVSQSLTSAINSGVNGTFGNYSLYFMSRAAAALFGAGSMAEVAIYNVNLDAGEAGALAKGYSPALIRPASLIAYWPMLRDNISYLDGTAPTLTGTTVGPHPRIIMPHSGRTPWIPAIVYVYARPDADSIDGSWTNELNTQTNLFASIDETAEDDADYIISSNNPSNDIVKISLSDPGPVAEPATVSYRYCKRGEVSVAVNLTVDLLQGVTSIASWAHTDIGTTFTTVNQTLTAPQFAAISDFNDLYLQFNAST